MITITAPKELEQLLKDLDEVAEVRAASGKVLGYITPASVEERTLYAEAKKLFGPNEELLRREKEEGGYTVEQVLQHLKSLETPK
ncbi:MAG: hypothetical protein AB7K24_31980 [Gemmataceae bacterium]